MANWQITAALALILTALGWGDVMAASQPPHRHVAAGLIAATSAAVPGKTLTVAVRERMEPGWHTYWTNPGTRASPLPLNGPCRMASRRGQSCGRFRM